MTFIKKTDLIIIAGILLVSLASWIVFRAVTADDKVWAEIYIESDLVMTVDLTEGTDRYFSVDGKPMVIFHQTADGKISFHESDCPDKVCINAGKLSVPGHFAACLPNGVIMRIMGEKKDKDAPDIIIGSTGVHDE